MLVGTDDPTSTRRRWVAVGLATALELVSYWSLLRAYVAGREGLGPEVVGPSFFFGMIMVPFVFVALAFVSRHPNAPMAVLKGMGLFLLVGLPVGLLIPVLGLVAGFGVGGVVTYRMDETHRYGSRLIAVGAISVYTLVLMIIATPIGVFTGGFLPFVAIVFADRYSEEKTVGSGPREPSDPD
ncbi:MAG: hypothetical protein U9N79_06250 [Actinomycetota bacterium]|nr:hypothetical protein [Actinomycetota bacterium]